jgi:hypothetical protein
MLQNGCSLETLGEDWSKLSKFAILVGQCDVKVWCCFETLFLLLIKITMFKFE